MKISDIKTKNSRFRTKSLYHKNQRQISLLKRQVLKLELKHKSESVVETKNLDSKNVKLVSQNKALKSEKLESDSLISSLRNQVVQLKSRRDFFKKKIQESD